jgi:nucleoside 2-deoxyribosyltransferase
MFFHVVMPVGSNPNKEENQKIISDVAGDHGMSPHFPRYATEYPVFNLQSTLQDLRQCEFVLADLSFERPSCYYELGLAEALGKPVYLIAKEGTDIHQTASRRLVSFYKNNVELVGLLHDIFSGTASDNC